MFIVVYGTICSDSRAKGYACMWQNIQGNLKIPCLHVYLSLSLSVCADVYVCSETYASITYHIYLWVCVHSSASIKQMSYHIAL